MEATKETFKAAALYAIEHDEVIFATTYKGNVAYHVHDYSDDDTFTGYPLFVIVDEGLNCRYSSTVESLEIMKLKK